MLKWMIGVSLAAAAILIFHQAESCNEAVCGSIVSKCLLTQACKCDLKNCTCCKECFSCLNYLYSECCSCVDMCPKPNDTGSALSKKSHVEDFPDSIPGLFNALTEKPDNLERWTSFTYPIDFDTTLFAPRKEMKLHFQSVEQDVIPVKPNITTLNCTVAFMYQCMSWEKCKTNCQSMGASSYRWFHNGCCECIGDTCINYGINESRCRECSLQDESASEDSTLTDDDLDFGELDYPEGED